MVQHLETDLDLEGERVANGADVVIVGKKDAIVADNHAMRVDVLLGPGYWSEKFEYKIKETSVRVTQ